MITDSTNFDLLGDGRARFYIDEGYIESIFYGCHFLHTNNDFIFYYVTYDVFNFHEDNEKNLWKEEALGIMMKNIGIDDFCTVSGKIKTATPMSIKDTCTARILKFYNKADEAFFRMSYLHSFIDTTSEKFFIEEQ